MTADPEGGYDWTDELPRIETARLVLRPLAAADAPDLFAIFRDREVARYWSSPPMIDPREAAALIAEVAELFAERTLFEWGVARRADDRAIGTVTLWKLEPENRRAEVGFALARAAWGQGLMGEALVALLDFAFGPLALHRLEADVDPRNERSLKALERLGFRREGLLRERYFVAGEIQDSVILGLLAREWRARRAGG